MAETPPNAMDWKDRLKAELRRDKKKTATLAVLLTVAGIVGGRAAISYSLPDDAGAAAAPAPAESADADERDAARPWPAPGGGGGRDERTQYLAGMDRTIARDLFRPNLDYFPPLPGAEPDAPGTGQDDPGWFGSVQDRVSRKQQAASDELTRIAAIRAQAGALSLQSTMLGNHPTALVNGQVLRPGDYVSGFRVKSIASDRCVVSKDGVDVELRMEN